MIEVKVSTDRGETWHRRKINMSVDLDDSAFAQVRCFNSTARNTEVLAGDSGLRVKLLKMAKVGKKQATKRR